MTLEKIIDLGGCSGWGPDYRSVHAQTLEKTASECYTPQTLVDVMEKLRPRPEGRYILLNALGSYEYWGVNRNGDAFPEWSLRGQTPPKSVTDIVDMKVRPIIPSFTTPHGRYGHKTFVDFAHVYVGHKNNDPAKSIGDVIASAYNDKMHRVELIVFVYTDRNPELIEKIDAGEPVPFSMGAKLQFDTCSICLNCARTRGEYCSHLSTLLGQTLPDGRRVFAYNFFPRFFDISYVRVPADRSAWQLRKVAGQPTSIAMLPEKKYFSKLSEMVKNEPSEGKNLGSAPVHPDLIRFIREKANAKYCSQPEDEQLVAALKKHKLSKVLATLTSMGILLRPTEVTKLSSRSPEGIPSKFSVEDVDVNILRTISPYIESRSFYEPYFSKQAFVSKDKVTSDRSEEFESYCDYLKSIDFTKLAEWVDTSPTAKVSLGFDDFLFKVAGLTPKHRNIPTWLPFAATVLRFDSIT
mgnify:CR=1 FL=1